MTFLWCTAVEGLRQAVGRRPVVRLGHSPKPIIITSGGKMDVTRKNHSQLWRGSAESA
jgi:hypothetical protein